MVAHSSKALALSEEQLRRNNDTLKKLSETKTSFISIAAHELRTPLTSIVGYLDLITEGRFGELPTTMDRPVAALRRNVHRLTTLVDDMLDVSRIQAGRVTLYRAPVNLPYIAADAVDELRPRANAKQQELIVEFEDVGEVSADEDKLHQIVSNLLANAIRYAAEGGTVLVRTDHFAGPNSTADCARLRVRHSGGIPRRLRDRVFEPFFNVHSTQHHTSADPDSAGLGLYIARGLVELHGGVIKVQTQENRFTEFTVLLPFP